MKLTPKTKAGKMKKVGKVMKEFKTGSLHSGKGGKVVKSPKQAIAIALSEAGMAKKKGK
jgi:ribosomal protein L21E